MHNCGGEQVAMGPCSGPETFKWLATATEGLFQMNLHLR